MNDIYMDGWMAFLPGSSHGITDSINNKYIDGLMNDVYEWKMNEWWIDGWMNG